MWEGAFYGLANFIMGLIVFAIIATCLILGGFVYFGWEYFHKKEIVSKVRITPEIKLTTDGKRIDTLFVYKSH